MEDHTSGTDFATDLLSGKWKFIGNGAGSNVSQTQLLSSPLTTTGADVTATLSDSINNYDYAILTFSPTASGIRKSEVIKVNGTINSFVCLMEYTTQANALHYAQVSGAISNSDITIRNRNADVTWASIDLESVVGIKIQELTTDYLASLSMPSDVYESITLNGATGVKFVAPYDGYIGICVLNNSTKVNCILCYQTENNLINGKRNIIVATPPITTNEYYATVYFPVKKDGVWFLHKTDSNNLIYSNFFYTVGAAKALGLID